MPLTSEEKQYNRRSSDKAVEGLGTRLSVLENRFDTMESQLTKHENESRELWLKIANTLDDIKTEITNFRFTKIEDAAKIEKEITAVKQKLEIIETTARTSWKTLTIVAGLISFIVGLAIKLL